MIEEWSRGATNGNSEYAVWVRVGLMIFSEYENERVMVEGLDLLN
jgi:hypothetical protein